MICSGVSSSGVHLRIFLVVLSFMSFGGYWSLGRQGLVHLMVCTSTDPRCPTEVDLVKRLKGISSAGDVNSQLIASKASMMNLGMIAL